jgi:hypothetical protein
MQLACPAAADVRGLSDLGLLTAMQLECVEPSRGERVQVAVYLGGGPAGGSQQARGSGGGGGQLAFGAIVGLVLGLAVLVAAAAAAVYFVGYRRFYQERRARSFQAFEAAGDAQPLPAKVASRAAEVPGPDGGAARDAPV